MVFRTVQLPSLGTILTVPSPFPVPQVAASGGRFGGVGLRASCERLLPVPEPGFPLLILIVTRCGGKQEEKVYSQRFYRSYGDDGGYKLHGVVITPYVSSMLYVLATVGGVVVK
jgi:hypothetical protein